jgi:hypothetical protein
MTTVIYQKFVFRSDLQANPAALYLFGDNTIRVGYGGQAKEMRDEPNAVGVATKRAPGRQDKDYFSDDTFEENCSIIDTDILPAFVHVALRGTLIIPADGLGTGLSELPQRAPRTNAYLEAWLTRLLNPLDHAAHSVFERFINSRHESHVREPVKVAMALVANTVIIPELREQCA